MNWTSDKSGLFGKRFHLVAAERLFEIARIDLLVLAAADPGIGNVALTVFLQLLEDVAKPAVEDAAKRAARSAAGEDAAEDVAKTTRAAAA